MNNFSCILHILPKILKISCLEQKRVNGKRSYNYWKWLGLFKKYTKLKNIIVIGSFLEEQTVTEKDWYRKEEKIQQDFLWALGLQAIHQITITNTELNRKKWKRQTTHFILDISFTETDKKQLTRFLLAKRLRYGKTRRSMGENVWVRKRLWQSSFRQITGHLRNQRINHRQPVTMQFIE